MKIPEDLHDRVVVFLNHLEEVLPDDALDLIDYKIWNSLSCWIPEVKDKAPDGT